MSTLSRRQFMTHTAGLAAAAALPVSPAFLRAFAQSGQAANLIALTRDWEYFQGSLDTPWEVWNSAEIAVFDAVTVPHCFNHYDACDPDTPAYRGQGWYRTHLGVANPYPQGRTLLHFGGAGQTTDVFLGDEHLATHVGGYDEFMVDLTDAIARQAAGSKATGPKAAKGEAKGLRLAIRCDNGRDLERMPSDLSDFTLYGGLYRPVTLVYVPAVSIESVHVHVTPGKAGGAAEVTVTGRLYAPAQAATDSVSLELKLVDPKGKTLGSKTVKWSGAGAAGTLFEGERTLAQFTIANPSLWSPGTPHLYQAQVALTAATGTHALAERFGVRTTEFVEDGPFHCNGERMLLRGTHRHEDHANYAAAMPADLIRQELRLVKDVGANFIRLGHYQQSRLVLDLCDELGIFVWEELTWCRAGVGGEKFQQMGRDKLHNMIDQHINHPCVVLWGLGNEDDWPNEFPSVDKDAIRTYLTELRDLAHKLDPTRMTSIRRCDFARDIPDVYSPSIWAGWYGGRYVDYQGSLEKQRKLVKRMIHIEWGADSHAGRHAEDPYALLTKLSEGQTAEVGMAYLKTGGDARASRDGDWSETYACDLFDWHLKVQESLPWLTGTAQWIFKDFTTPLRADNPVPRVNQKGLVTRDMTPKEAYYVFQSYWTTKPMVRLYGHDWPVRWGGPNEARMVRVYSNCATAELFVNGKSAGVKHRDAQDFPCAGLRWMVPFAAGKNHLRVVARPASGAAVEDSVEFTYQTEKWTQPAHLTLTQVKRQGDTVTCMATLTDEKGVRCLDARNVVRFSLAGAGRLIDNQGTPTGSRVVQLYNGRAEISMHLLAGNGTLAVASEGIPTATCALT